MICFLVVQIKLDVAGEDRGLIRRKDLIVEVELDIAGEDRGLIRRKDLIVEVELDIAGEDLRFLAESVRDDRKGIGDTILRILERKL